jgi:hypothetical protein
MKLPDSVQEIADVIGREQALLLINSLPRAYRKDPRWPGAQISRVIMYVPTVPRLNANHQLVQILGWHDALKLCKAFGGEIMQPANCAFIQKQERDGTIRRLLGQGMTKAQVAEQVGVTERTVRNLVRVMENPPQGMRAANDDNAEVINEATA